LKLREENQGMIIALFRFIALIFFGILTGISFSHLIEAGPKAQLAGPVFLIIQQILLKNFIAVRGFIDLATIGSLLILVILLRGRRTAFWLSLLSLGSLMTVIGIWAIFLKPINAQINSWTVMTMPGKWIDFRDLWQYYHLLGEVFLVFGYSMLILSVLLDSRVRNKK
jgi:hypothetical protein